MPSSAPTNCSHRPTCPGCPHFGVPGIARDALARVRRLAEAFGAATLPPSTASADLSKAFGHRHRARLMVRGRAASPKIGIFQAGSHKIADIPHCHVQHEVVNRVAALLKEAIRATATEPYAEGPHRGCVRAVQIVVERRSRTAQVVVVTNDADPSRAIPLWADFETRLRAAGVLQSLWWNGNPERTNTILGTRFELLAAADENGDGWVRESIGGAEVFFPPGAFGQNHLQLADELVAKIHGFSADAEHIAECYAGCGSIGLGLVARGANLAFNEQNPAGIAGLERGLDVLGVRNRARVFPGAAGERLDVLGGAQVAIVDPPRKGLDAPLRARLAGGAVDRVAYVSCGLDSLERDAAALVEPGRMKLVCVEPFALFPFTEHVETLALFERD